MGLAPAVSRLVHASFPYDRVIIPCRNRIRGVPPRPASRKPLASSSPLTALSLVSISTSLARARYYFGGKIQGCFGGRTCLYEIDDKNAGETKRKSTRHTNPRGITRRGAATEGIHYTLIISFDVRHY